MKLLRAAVCALLPLLLLACEEWLVAPGPPASRVYRVANECLAVAAFEREFPFVSALSATASGETYAFAPRWPWRATPFFLKASRLGSYLFYDEGGSYLVSDGERLLRQQDLLSDVLLVDDSFESDAEWTLESVGGWRARSLRLRHRKSGRYVSTDGLVDDPRDAAGIVLFPRSGCAEFPEASLDATGRVRARRFADGSLFGFVDTHSHLLSNFGFGGAGIVHGAPFHPLGVEHALPDCATYHGDEGRQDLMGFAFDNEVQNPTTLLVSFLTGRTPVPNHATAGWPEFTEWPDAHRRATHQSQYYKWLERAYLGGLRLVVQHATSNQIICDLVTGIGAHPRRYSCNDMVAVDRSIEEAYALEDYIDAQAGGPGKGWFRIVTSPAQARRVIARGKLAVVLGIETSNLFDCSLLDAGGCTEEYVAAQLDRYRARGVRAIFPVHKYDNAFSAGDGQKLFIELGNFVQTGHYSNFVSDCPTDVPSVFDRGAVAFPGLNRPRDDYFEPPPNDMSGFSDDPIGTVLPFLGFLLEPSDGQEVCQKQGLTELGEFLIERLMRRGMIIEIDHLPRRSYRRAFELLEQNDYPAAGTHGLDNSGALYRLGGISTTGFGRCRSASASATMDDGFQARVRRIDENGGFPAIGFGFDLNGFAGAPGPRFGPDSHCADPQQDPITYPFQSYAGDVTFHEPRLGNRAVDFDTEGMIHIGLVPELIEDVRRDGVSDAELEPLFKSAEGYLRMWEKAERRGAELSGRRAGRGPGSWHGPRRR